VLRKDLLRVSRAGGGYRPRFATREHRPLAARVLGTFESHVGERRGDLDDALAALEADAAESGGDFKLVRGLAALIERECVFETRAPVPPQRVRRAAFEAAEAVGVASETERETAIDRAADALGIEPGDVEASLYADRDVNEILVDADVRWDPDSLLEQYDLSLAQTALFDATEVRIRSNDPKRLVSAVKRLRLMYEVETTPRAENWSSPGRTRCSRAPGATGPRSRDCSGPSRSPRSGSCRRRSTTAAASAPCASPTAT